MNRLGTLKRFGLVVGSCALLPFLFGCETYWRNADGSGHHTYSDGDGSVETRYGYGGRLEGTFFKGEYINENAAGRTTLYDLEGTAILQWRGSPSGSETVGKYRISIRSGDVTVRHSDFKRPLSVDQSGSSIYLEEPAPEEEKTKRRRSSAKHRPGSEAVVAFAETSGFPATLIKGMLCGSKDKVSKCTAVTFEGGHGRSKAEAVNRTDFETLKVDGNDRPEVTLKVDGIATLIKGSLEGYNFIETESKKIRGRIHTKFALSDKEKTMLELKHGHKEIDLLQLDRKSAAMESQRTTKVAQVPAVKVNAARHTEVSIGDDRSL